MVGQAIAAALTMAMATAAPAAEIGRILTYTRANSDGSEAETVSVYRASASRIEVIKTRERCTSAAFVSAELDPEHGDAKRLTGGRLLPGGRHSEEAWLDLARDGRLAMRLGDADAVPSATIAIGQRPWHLYDFDLATLSAAPPAEAKAGRDFSFGLALSLAKDEGLDLRWLGRVDAHYVGRQQLGDRSTHHFKVSGPGLPGAMGGDLWTDAAAGYVVRAQFGMPNHVEYRDFTLTLTEVQHGAPAWEEKRVAHYRGCPAR